MSTDPRTEADAPVARCRGVSVVYGRRRVLDGIDVELGSGITCLIGRNGAGKTTLFRLLCGILRPSAGEVRVLGADPAASGTARQAIGYLTHRPSLYRDLTVHDNLAFWARVIGLDWEANHVRIDHLVRRFGLADKLDQRAGTLSRGQRQRVAIARMLLAQPALVLMDEPGTGLDALALRELHALVGEMVADGVSAVYATHAIDEAARLGDQFLLLAGGTATSMGRNVEPAGNPAMLADRLLQRLAGLEPVPGAEQHDNGKERVAP